MGKNKPRTTTTAATAASNEECALCCNAIVEGEEEALLCEGDGSCNKWMHRYCAGVSASHYESLVKSPLPFNCSLCVQQKQAAMIDEMKSTIAALTAEVRELRTALQSTTVRAEAGSDNSTAWSEVVQRGSARSGNHSRSHSGKLNDNKQRKAQTSRVGGKPLNSNTNVSHKNHEQGARIIVPGVRRVWGTMKNTSPAAVISTLTKLTSQNLGSKLTVRRKFKESTSGRDRWWFLLKGEERVLKELEDMWNTVSLQTRWKLETCTKPRDDNATDGEKTSDSPLVPNEPSTSTSSSHHQGLSVTATEPDNESGLCQDEPQPASNQDPSDEETSTSFLVNGHDTALNT